MAEIQQPTVDEFKALIAEYKKLGAAICDISRLKADKPESLGKFMKYIEEVPCPIDEQITTLKKRSRTFIDAENAKRKELFKPMVSEFIWKRENQGVKFKEKGDGWRIGPIRMIVDAASSRVSFMYNDEPLKVNKIVAQESDLEKYYDQTLDMLKKSVIEEKKFDSLVKEAYDYGMRELREKKPESNKLPLLDLYKYIQVILFKRTLENSKGGKKKINDFPKWAFLYNMDRYIAMPNEAIGERRLKLDPGSQMDMDRGNFVKLYGLKPDEGYITCSYILEER